MNQIKDFFSKAGSGIRNFIWPKEDDNPIDQEFSRDDIYRNRRLARRKRAKLRIERYLSLLLYLGLIVIVIGGIIFAGRKISSNGKINHVKSEYSEIYTDSNQSDLKDSVTEGKLTNLSHDVNSLPNSDAKVDLQKQATESQHMLKIKNSYNKFFTDKQTLKEDVTPKKILDLKNKLGTHHLPNGFLNKYSVNLSSDFDTATKAKQLHGKYNDIMDTYKAGGDVDTKSVDQLIKDLKDNNKSEQSLKLHGKLVKFRKKLVSEQKSKMSAQELAAQQAAEDAQAAAAQKAQEDANKAAEKAAKEAAEQQKEAEKAAEKQAEQDAQNQQAVDAANAKNGQQSGDGSGNGSGSGSNSSTSGGSGLSGSTNGNTTNSTQVGVGN